MTAAELRAMEAERMQGTAVLWGLVGVLGLYLGGKLVLQYKELALQEQAQRLPPALPAGEAGTLEGPTDARNFLNFCDS